MLKETKQEKREEDEDGQSKEQQMKSLGRAEW